MSDLAELFARDPLEINSEGKTGFTDAELKVIVDYFRDLRAKNLIGGAKKPPAPLKVSLDDLDV